MKGHKMMNDQTKHEIIRELVDDLEVKRGFSLLPEKRQEIKNGLWPYLDGMENFLRKIERKL